MGEDGSCRLTILKIEIDSSAWLDEGREVYNRDEYGVRWGTDCGTRK